MKTKNLVIPLILITVFLGLTPLSGFAAGESLSCARSQVRVFSTVKFTGDGLTVSTFYTLYMGTTLLDNKSTTATATNLIFEHKFGMSDVGENVAITMKNSSGTGAALGTVYLDILEIIDENTANLLGYVLSDILPIVFILTVVFGLPGMIIAAIGLKKSGRI